MLKKIIALDVFVGETVVMAGDCETYLVMINRKTHFNMHFNLQKLATQIYITVLFVFYCGQTT